MSGKTFVGSAKELAGKVVINGKKVSAPELSILSTLGIIKVKERVANASGKGKKTNRLLVESGSFELVVDDYVTPMASVEVTDTNDAGEVTDTGATE